MAATGVPVLLVDAASVGRVRVCIACGMQDALHVARLDEVMIYCSSAQRP
ncbi:hypothetical protein PI124_g3997 [Phytophthora idaei]|nr:hypothetical protein PI126_g24310 [Phytophthora idaei]KAG3251357.1 hypothetical protein PI124_g3997 [Phytophthora idaei]